MNRRHFLGSLAALSAGMVIDPEMALWVPGRKSYFHIPQSNIRNLTVTIGGLPPYHYTFEAPILVQPGDHISMRIDPRATVPYKIEIFSDYNVYADGPPVPRSVPRKPTGAI